MQKALAASIFTHVALFGFTRHSSSLQSAPIATPPIPAPTTDIWAGQTTALSGGERLYEIAVEGPTTPHAADPGTSTPAAQPAPQPPPKPTVALHEHGKPDEPRATDKPRRPPAPRRTPKPPGDIRATPRDPTASPAHTPDPTDPGAGSNGGPAGSFGAEGPAAARDMGRAFTRAIPAASSADPGWTALPLGDAGTIEIAIDIDETGHVTDWRPVDASPPKQLVSMVRRTMVLLESGTFSLKPGSIARGVQVLKLHARVSEADPDTDDAPGGGVRLQFTYQGGRGTAAFTQQSRRVEVSVQVVRVEIKG